MAFMQEFLTPPPPAMLQPSLLRTVIRCMLRRPTRVAFCCPPPSGAHDAALSFWSTILMINYWKLRKRLAW